MRVAINAPDTLSLKSIVHWHKLSASLMPHSDAFRSQPYGAGWVFGDCADSLPEPVLELAILGPFFLMPDSEVSWITARPEVSILLAEKHVNANVAGQRNANGRFIAFSFPSEDFRVCREPY